MDFTPIIQAISSIGFPAVMCLIMFKFMNNETEAHREEVAKMTEALNNNTLALNRLEMKMGVDHDDS